MKIKIILFTFIYYSTMIAAIQSHKKMFDDDDKKISYRNSLQEIKRPTHFTELRPDDHSSALRLSKEQLGRFSWAVLHSIAASFPSEPTEQDKIDLHSFMNTFASLFPCKNCGRHFREMLKENPIKCNSREELVYYMCDIHNIVNKRLNKKIFDCKKAFDFWGGNCGCGDDKNEDGSAGSKGNEHDHNHNSDKNQSPAKKPDEDNSKKSSESNLNKNKPPVKVENRVDKLNEKETK